MSFLLGLIIFVFHAFDPCCFLVIFSQQLQPCSIPANRVLISSSSINDYLPIVKNRHDLYCAEIPLLCSPFDANDTSSWQNQKSSHSNHHSCMLACCFSYRDTKAICDVTVCPSVRCQTKHARAERIHPIILKIGSSMHRDVIPVHTGTCVMPLAPYNLSTGTRRYTTVVSSVLCRPRSMRG